MKNAFQTWKNTVYIIIKKSPYQVLCLAILALIEAAGFLIQFLTIEYFINNILIFISTNNTSLLFQSTLLLIVVLIVRRIFNACFNYRLNVFIKKTKGIFELTYLEQISSIAMESFFSDTFETQKNQVKQGAMHASLFSMMSLMVLFFNIPYFLFLMIYFFHSSPYLIGVLLFVLLPTCINIKSDYKTLANMEENISHSRKRMAYLCDCLRDKRYRKETQILDGKDVFYRHYKNESNTYLEYTRNAQKKIFNTSLISLFPYSWQ